MSNVHIRMVEAANGDLIDLVYYHHDCAPTGVLGWPAPEELDYPVYCAGCGRRVYEVPLTREGRAEYTEPEPFVERMMPGQEPYTEAERALRDALIAAAAAGDPGEAGEG
jgi:hypothetical protein